MLAHVERFLKLQECCHGDASCRSPGRTRPWFVEEDNRNRVSNDVCHGDQQAVMVRDAQERVSLDKKTQNEEIHQVERDLP